MQRPSPTSRQPRPPRGRRSGPACDCAGWPPAWEASDEFYLEVTRPARVERPSNLRFLSPIPVTMMEDSCRVDDRNRKDIARDYQETDRLLHRLCAHRRADRLLCQGARGRRRVFGRLPRRRIGQHGQPRVTHLRSKRREADRAIDRAQAAGGHAASNNSQSGPDGPE